MLNNKWIVNELTEKEKKSRQRLTEETNINQTLCTLLVERGIGSKEEARNFFRPSLEHIHDPFLMKDMDKAVNRLEKAVGNKERILIYGDYDVDGTTAVALVYKCLQTVYSDIDFYIPDRYNEGYGVSYKGIDYAAENGFSLIIVLDCGIKAIEKVKYAKSKGIDIIICDHHTPDETLPDAVAVLDAKRPDNTYPYEHLSGCGVGFKFMQAFAMSNGMSFEDKLEPLLDLLAVSIASDIVPISGENRVLMHYGLRRLNTNPCIGLRAILEVCQLKPGTLTTSDIVFKIGPRINASGRMSSGREAVELLISKDITEAKEKSSCIDKYNQDRKTLDKKTTDEAISFLEECTDLGGRNSTVVYNPEWNKGVIGIVASRLSEKYYRPTVVMTKSNGFATGSARSITGFDIYNAIDSCRDLLENFGGHLYAAGLTMKEENVHEFARRFDKYVGENLTEEQKIPQINADAEINIAEISDGFFKILQEFAPFGPDNTKPVFISRGLVDTRTSRPVGQDQRHLKLDLRDPSTNKVMNGIGFGLGDKFNLLKNGPVDIIYTIEENNFNGSKSIQLMVKDIKQTGAE